MRKVLRDLKILDDLNIINVTFFFIWRRIFWRSGPCRVRRGCFLRPSTCLRCRFHLFFKLFGGIVENYRINLPRGNPRGRRLQIKMLSSFMPSSSI